MNAKKMLIALLIVGAALSAVVSFVDTFHIREPQWFTIGSTIALSLLMFGWYYLDSEERAYRRTPLLNIAVVALGFLAIPYYVVRSRAPGVRLKAFAKCIGFGVLFFVVSMLAALPAALINPG